MIARKVGEIFEYEGVKLKVVQKCGCFGCYFYVTGNMSCLKENQSTAGYCDAYNREDETNVIFERV